jgi:tRNA threonylcarbamoyl adenosine modification protein YeaZ
MTSPACSPDPGPLLLVLDGAGDRLQFLLAEGEREPALLCCQDWAVAGQSARFLAPALDNALTLFGRKAADIRRIACVRGPGGFTGIRLVLALAEGLAAATGALRAGLELLPLLAAGPAALRPLGSALVLTWSRKSQVFAQGFGLPELAPLSQPADLALEQAAALALSLPGPLTLLGSGLARNRAFFQERLAHLPDCALLGPEWNQAGPLALLAAAARAEYADRPVEPLYLRASDAEESLAAFAQARGLDELTAKALLAPGSSLKG